MANGFNVQGGAHQHVLVVSDGAGRFLIVLFALAVGLMCATPMLAAHAYLSLETLLSRTNAPPRAFVREYEILIFFPNDAQGATFTASWTKPLAAGKFAYVSATLDACETPKRMPEAKSQWREAAVLSKAESNRRINGAADRLVPREPGRGIFCRYALGEAVLYRNADGQVELASNETMRAQVSVARRYTRQGLASAVAEQFEKDLRADHPGQTAFVVQLGGASRTRLVFLDLSERRAVILYPPSKLDNPGQVAHAANKVSNLGSFILIDNVFSFLKNPVTSSVRAVNQLVQWPFTVLTPRLRGKPFIPPLTNAPGMDLATWEHWLDHHTHSHREQGSLKLMIDGDSFFPAFERRVAGAQRGVSILVCIFDRDDVGVEVANRLKQRSTNIEVKVVFDRLMSRQAASVPPATPMRQGFVPPDSIAAYLQKDSRVQVRPQLNPAFSVNHTKVYLVDGRYAYIGGMNVGREYRYEWHDMIAEVQGPVVASFQQQFDKKWTQVGLGGDYALAVKPFSGKKAAPVAEPDVELIELRRLYTRSFSRQIRRAELAAINRASSYVFAENPYFYSNDLLNALVRARRRGVDVRVVLPSENDLAAGHKSNLVTANYLEQQGVRVYIYPGMTHVKALLVDGWACFGSANFDALSLRLIGETDLATSNPSFAAKFRQQLFEADFARSRELREILDVDWSDYLADSLLSPF
jgi:phosphatidylserine/phosphatidylglycerophosphate/cardiolipin synthase-like enzyme